MMLLVRGEEPVLVPAYPVKVRDVSGAGDTAIAVLTLGLLAGARPADARRGDGSVFHAACGFAQCSLRPTRLGIV